MSEVPCLQCGKPRSRLWLERIRCTESREAFSILACDACGVCRTTPVPDDLTPYYRSEAGRRMHETPSRFFAWLQRLRLRGEVRRVGRFGRELPWIDVGAGSGGFALALHRHGLRVHTADASAEPPCEAGRDIPHHVFDFADYRIRERTAGECGVVLRHVLEHAVRPARMLEALQEQGARSFYIVVPNLACLERRLLGRFWFLWDPPRHLWHFNARSLEALCRHSGLEVLAMGRDTIGNLAPSLHRALTLAGWTRLGRFFAPRSLANALTAPLNWLLPGNVLWVVAKKA